MSIGHKIQRSSKSLFICCVDLPPQLEGESCNLETCKTIALIQLLVVVFSMLAVMTYRVSMASVMWSTVDFFPKSQVKLFVTCTAATLNLLVIVILNKVLDRHS